MSLTQAKLEEAVLWVLVTKDFGDQWRSPYQVNNYLGGQSTDTKISVAMQHLAECGMAKNTGGLTDNYEPTRDGILLVESLIANPKSFLSRLNKYGSEWLRTPAAIDARATVKFTPSAVSEVAEPIENEPERLLDEFESAGRLQIVNNFNPTITASQIAPSAAENSKKLKISWAGWLGAAATVLSIVAALWIAGKL